VLSHERIEVRHEGRSLGVIDVPRPVARRSRLRLALIAIDGAALLVAWTLPFVSAFSAERAFAAVFAVLCGHVALRATHLYLARVCAVSARETAGLLQASAVTGAAVLLAGRWWPSVTVTDAIVASLLAFLLLRIARTAFRAWLRAARRDGRHVRTVLIIGANDDAKALSGMFRDHPEIGYRVIGVLGDHHEHARNGIADVWLGSVDDLEVMLESARPTGVFIASGGVPPDELAAVMRLIQAHGAHVQVSLGLRSVARQRLRSQLVGHEPMLYVEPPLRRRSDELVKTAFDRTVATVLLVLAAPVFAAAAIAVKLGDRGPVLFRQKRVGRDGQMFSILKFRTMVVDAEGRIDELHPLNARNGPLFKLDHDPRVTGVGHFLRLTSLDELPQLINVLRGDMSLVGPRPALPHEAAQFDADLQRRAAVRPGVTGLWQVVARDNPSFDSYRRLDLFYVENWSLAFDVVILAKTLSAVIARTLRRATSSATGRIAAG
jgi:exopolysaccharide biosynthesis polyprenyl glycosylphosphotransferase